MYSQSFLSEPQFVKKEDAGYNGSFLMSIVQIFFVIFRKI